MANSSNSRIKYIDYLKAYTIILVVLGHVAQHYLDDEALLVRVIFSFHIPLFMFLSGYCSYKISTWKKVKERFMQLIIPFISYSVLKYFVYNSNYSVSSFLQHMGGAFLHPDDGLWFIWSLFFIIAVFVLCRKIAALMKTKDFYVFAFVAIVLNAMTVVLNIKLFGFHWISWYFIYFVGGVLWRKGINTEFLSAKQHKIVLLVMCILFPLCACTFRLHNEAPLFYEYVNLGGKFPILFRLIAGFVGVFFSFEVFSHLFKSMNNKFLEDIGKCTLGIYYIHFFVMHYAYMVDYIENMPKLISLLITWLAALLVSWILCKLIERSRLLSFIILGK